MHRKSLIACLAVVAVAGSLLIFYPAETMTDAVVAPPSPPDMNSVHTVEVVRGLEHPWSLAFLPNNDLLVTERPGRLRRVRNGTLDPAPIAGVPPVFASGQGGLLDVTLHPRFNETKLIFLSYSHGSEEANGTRVVRARLDDSKLSDVTVIFEARPLKPGGQHFGSRFAWMPDETLLVSVGDGGNPPTSVEGTLSRNHAQNRAKRLGKVVRITTDGEAPKDNPFLRDSEADPVVWSYGHRNIQGMLYDSASKRVWATEHGSRGGDELNVLSAGANFGWPAVSYSREYTSPQMVAPVQHAPEVLDPLLIWTPSIAPSGLALYRGERFPQWRGDLFAGALAGTALWRIDLDEAGRVVGQERLRLNRRVRDVRMGPDGFLYLLTDESNGALLRLEPQ